MIGFNFVDHAIMNKLAELAGKSSPKKAHCIEASKMCLYFVVSELSSPKVPMCSLMTK